MIKIRENTMTEGFAASSAERDRSGNRRQGGLRVGRSQRREISGTDPMRQFDFLLSSTFFTY